MRRKVYKEKLLKPVKKGELLKKVSVNVIASLLLVCLHAYCAYAATDVTLQFSYSGGNFYVGDDVYLTYGITNNNNVCSMHCSASVDGTLTAGDVYISAKGNYLGGASVTLPRSGSSVSYRLDVSCTNDFPCISTQEKSASVTVYFGRCGDSVINGPEQCDSGSSNGVACSPSYGSSCSYCDSSCTSRTLSGAYCGDGSKNGPEQCDSGSANGRVCNPNYGSSCTYCDSACRSVTKQGGYCGDRIRNGQEVCDGDTISCSVVNSKYYSSNYAACQSNCNGYNTKECHYCGDGVKDSNEECDDASNNGKFCSVSYGSSCNYCSSSCKLMTKTGGSCGDGSADPEENCSSCYADVPCAGGPNACQEGTCIDLDSNSNCGQIGNKCNTAVKQVPTGKTECNSDSTKSIKYFESSYETCLQKTCQKKSETKTQEVDCTLNNTYCQEGHCGCSLGFDVCEKLKGCFKTRELGIGDTCSCDFQCSEGFCEQNLSRCVPELNITDIINKVSTQTVFFSQGGSLNITILGEEHSATVDQIGTDFVKITLKSNAMNFLIKLFNTINIDVNNDKISDLSIKLSDIRNNLAVLEFGKPSSSTPTDPLNNLSLSFFSTYIWYVAVLLGSFLLILSIVFISRSTTPKQTKKVLEGISSESKSETDEAISVTDFTIKAKGTMILDNVSFKVKKGELVCLLGPSGTGKSTVIESLVGRKTPTKGTIRILGKDITKTKGYEQVGFVPQQAELYLDQTVLQNLFNSATKWDVKDADKKIDDILSKIGLEHRKDIKAGSLSGGQQKLLSLGMELIREIEVCVLDEPTTGLDPNTRNSILTILSNISRQLHKTVFFTTHFMDDAEECDSVIILANTKIVAEGTPTKLEKGLPGGGKVVNVVLDNVTEEILKKIETIEGVTKLIREGRNIRIITQAPNAVKLGQKIDEAGGTVNETKIDNATMMDVFVFHTGQKPDAK